MIAVNDYWNTLVADFILEQFKTAANWQYILKACISQYEFLEKEVWKLASVLDFKCRVKNGTPSGELLDFIAGIVGIERREGENDAALYGRVNLRIKVVDEGTPDFVIYNAVRLSGDPSPIYFEESPATLFVYTPKGRQIRRSEVRKLGAAGVTAVPAAALKLADGRFLVCNRHVVNELTDDEGFSLTDDDNYTLTYDYVTNARMLIVARDQNIGNVNSNDFE